MDSSQDILEKMIRREKKVRGKQLVAPVLCGRKVRIAVGTFQWECRLDREFSGWGVFEMCAPGRATLVREAEFWEKEEYLAAYPRASFMLFYQDSRGTWWGWDFKSGQFVQILLVEGQLQFDMVTAAFDGSRHWYVGADSMGDEKKAESLRRSLKAGAAPESLSIPGLTPREYDLFEMASVIAQKMGEMQKDVFVRKIEQALQMGSADLLECAEVDSGYRVRWKRGAHTLTSLVDRNLSVINAGLCLSGQDKIQDLTSLASLIATKPAGVPYVGDYNNGMSEEEYYRAHPY